MKMKRQEGKNKKLKDTGGKHEREKRNQIKNKRGSK